MRRVGLLLSALLFIAASGGLAASSYVDKPDVGGTSTFISPTLGYYQYKEEPSMMKITGPSYGLAFGHRYVGQHDFVWLLQGEVSVVNGKYDGSLQNGSPYSYAHDRSDIAALSLSLGRRFFITNQKDHRVAMITYIGLGYRYLLNDSSNNPHGYLRESNYVYLPVGVQLFTIKGQMVIQSQLEFDYLLQGTQHTDLPTSGKDYRLTNQQNSGYGANANLLFGRRHGSWTWLVGPYVKYWNIAESDVVVIGFEPLVEPKNNTLEAGITFRLVF